MPVPLDTCLGLHSGTGLEARASRNQPGSSFTAMPYGVGFLSTLVRATIIGKAKDHFGRSQPFLRRSAGRTAFPISTGDGTFTRYDHSPKSARRRYKHTPISLACAADPRPDSNRRPHRVGHALYPPELRGPVVLRSSYAARRLGSVWSGRNDRGDHARG